MKRAKGTFRYSIGTAWYAIKLGQANDFQFTAYAAASWASDVEKLGESDWKQNRCMETQ